MPAGRPSTYDPSFCEAVIELGRAGKSPAQMAAALETTRTSMDRWKEAHEEFRAALEMAHDLSQAWWEDVGQNNLGADKFQTALWKKSVEARFRDDYTERREQNITGAMVVLSKDDADL